MSPISTYDFLNRKRRGLALDPESIADFIAAYLRGDVADYQMTAFLMAVAIHGMEKEELAALTRSMTGSGEQWKLRERFDFIGDKHSTGGVGDKVSIVLTPWVAACGVKVAMLSGRGLGHTGGTLDKLDAIPGFKARLSRAEIERCVDTVGCAIATSTEGIAPADRRMYALRDVTGTVESIPLITASIMSKKLAMGASALVLDVKTGSGAFMRELDKSRELARGLIDAASGSGTRTEALITNMDRPLGIAAGNANEIIESIETLRGHGPKDLYDVTRAQAVRLLVLSGRYDDKTAGAVLDDAIASGAALEKTRVWIAAQGGDASVVDDTSRFAQPRETVEVRAPRSGFISAIDTYRAGMIAVDMGAGRRKQEDQIDFAAGIMFDRNSGDEVRAGDVIARVQLGARGVESRPFDKELLDCISFADSAPASMPMVLEHLT
ncbi:MAG: thymidine phosphorylase [Thermoanaerobaculia bacterium]|nr:thymidine phosphorylase [Thermoanaerobaculia bacterium]